MGASSRKCDAAGRASRPVPLPKLNETGCRADGLREAAPKAAPKAPVKMPANPAPAAASSSSAHAAPSTHARFALEPPAESRADRARLHARPAWPHARHRLYRITSGLDQARAMDARVVLVIAGRERPVDPADRGDKRGAIRAKLLDWLAASHHAETIAAVRRAHIRHGGDGALYLVLRRT